MRFSRPFLLGAVTALVAAAVFSVPSLGERATPSATSGIRAVKNLEYKGEVPPGKEDGNRFTCPRKTPHAVSGYFVPDKPEQFGKVQLADSFPSGKGNRNWDIGVYNPTNEPQTYYVGVVCIR